jgi:hypothetical protein
MQFQWQFDHVTQILKSPAGWTITVQQIAQQLQDITYTRYDLTGPWAGWRIRGRVLRGRVRGQEITLTPESLRALVDDAAQRSGTVA